jgi:hypothetical protein
VTSTPLNRWAYDAREDEGMRDDERGLLDRVLRALGEPNASSIAR